MKCLIQAQRTSREMHSAGGQEKLLPSLLLRADIWGEVLWLLFSFSILARATHPDPDTMFVDCQDIRNDRAPKFVDARR